MTDSMKLKAIRKIDIKYFVQFHNVNEQNVSYLFETPLTRILCQFVSILFIRLSHLYFIRTSFTQNFHFTHIVRKENVSYDEGKSNNYAD